MLKKWLLLAVPIVLIAAVMGTSYVRGAGWSKR